MACGQQSQASEYSSRHGVMPLLIMSSELVVKVVNTEDMTRVIYLREQPKAVKHLSWHPSGSHLAVSCSDGIIYIYSLASEDEPQLVKKVDGIIRSLETEAEASSTVVWHPDGRTFAAPTATRGGRTSTIAFH
jgi:chromosome transmission fidelity protein 4